MNEFWGKFFLNISVSLRHPGWSYRTCWDTAQREWDSTYRLVYEDYRANVHVPRETQLEESTKGWTSHDEKKFVEAMKEMPLKAPQPSMVKANPKTHANTHRWASGLHPRNNKAK